MAIGQSDVPPQLEAYDLVSLPGGVDLAVGEGVGFPGSSEECRDGRPGKDILLRIIHEEILDGQHGDRDLWRWLAALQRSFEDEAALVGSAG